MSYAPRARKPAPRRRLVAVPHPGRDAVRLVSMPVAEERERAAGVGSTSKDHRGRAASQHCRPRPRTPRGREEDPGRDRDLLETSGRRREADAIRSRPQLPHTCMTLSVNAMPNGPLGIPVRLSNWDRPATDRVIIHAWLGSRMNAADSFWSTHRGDEIGDVPSGGTRRPGIGAGLPGLTAHRRRYLWLIRFSSNAGVGTFSVRSSSTRGR